MGKNKLSKFADMATYENVVEAPFQTPESPFHALRGNGIVISFITTIPLSSNWVADVENTVLDSAVCSPT